MSSLHKCGHEVLNYQQILLDSTDTTDYRVPDFMQTNKHDFNEHFKNKNVLSLYYTVLCYIITLYHYNIFHNP